MTISKLLIANRGEIASRVIRTARAMDIATVAVFSDPDAGLPFVPEADEAVRLPGSTPAETYLRGEALIAAAAATGADAVHPGYGFLSENAGFARACAAAGLTFVGPSPEAIEAMGSKTAAKELMAAAGVPVLPGGRCFDDEAEPDPAELRRPRRRSASRCWSRRPSAAAGAACGSSPARRARRGGGQRPPRGRVGVRQRHRVPRAVRGVAAAHRGADPRRPGRHRGPPVRAGVLDPAPLPEDHRGGAVPGRRRRLRAELCRAAVAAGQAIGYVGAGTVEFVLDAAGRFYFLEVNTRLQVEHPVTELITGLDLVRLQLEIAAGQPLPPEVTGARITGHAIEARLYAEDVPAGYLPASGDLHTFEIDRL